MIWSQLVVLYSPKGSLSLTIPRANASLQASEKAGKTQKFMGTFFTGPTKGVTPTLASKWLTDYTQL